MDNEYEEPFPLVVECVQCEALVAGVPLHSYECDDPEGGPPEKWTMLKCPRCGQPSLVLQNAFDRTTWDDPYRLYPPQRKPIDPSLPSTIRSSFEEAYSCLKVKAFTAATLMCRRTLEAICREHSMSGSLSKMLKDMREKGIIENRLFQWAEALRISGNEAAHNGENEIGGEDAKDIIEFTEALLEYLFTYRDKFDKFLQRRDKKRGKTA